MYCYQSGLPITSSRLDFQVPGTHLVKRRGQRLQHLLALLRAEEAVGVPQQVQLCGAVLRCLDAGQQLVKRLGADLLLLW